MSEMGRSLSKAQRKVLQTMLEHKSNIILLLGSSPSACYSTMFSRRIRLRTLTILVEGGYLEESGENPGGEGWSRVYVLTEKARGLFL